MFFCLLRRQDALLKAMREEHEQFRVLLRALCGHFEAEPELDASFEPPNRPLFVDEMLNAYERQERGDKPAMPDLKL